MEAKDSRKLFPGSHLHIDPNKATLFGLLLLLLSGKLKNSDFIETSIETEESFWYRLLIVRTILLQKFLLSIDIPMALVGWMFEFICNFYIQNGGFFGLLIRIITFKVVFPRRNSATYVSAVGITDMRTELSKDIVYGDDMYFPALSVMAAKAVYENAAYNKSVIEDTWGMSFIGFKNYWNDFLRKANTQVSLFRDKTADHDTIVVCFRGTSRFNAKAWSTDLDLSWYEISGIGRIHSGFLKALGMQRFVGWPKFVVPDPTRRAPLAYYDIRDTLKDLLNTSPEAKFIVTGHSLGGALAALFPTILFYHDERFLLERMQGVYTFGQPRVGDAEHASYMEKNLEKNGALFERYVYCNDIVPRVPMASMFKHFGTCVYNNSRYQATIVEEVPYENYFSFLGFIPKHLNAIYEVIRSFTMRIKYGSFYKEGWLVFGVRLIGILNPGVVNHGLRDYINSTRLGKTHRAFFHLPPH
ncbi:hypothetical protein like AT5G67050 [Hibiscus trionum]|uniref:Fungal lipase-type domain-containing protein n=1 Tax=Hibiscus trionum TaxID=183268 RepID=A0A9W7JH55_HIBTR|nr:hypothetical protein like AT5G67050 [Hibiscus trionum]